MHNNSPALNLKPLMAAYMICTMTMMAFVSIIGPIARLLSLAAWQVGMVVTVGGILWMLSSRPWGLLSDKRGRRTVLLTGLIGFAIAYFLLSALLVYAMHYSVPLWLVFAGLVLSRGAVGAFYAAIPSAGQALVADHVAPEKRAGAIASLGAANGVGLVLGPAVAAMLAQHSLELPLYITALLPILALAILWKALPDHTPIATSHLAPLKINDARLRKPMIIAFVGMFCVSIAQITVGFFAIDQLHLAPADALAAAGHALTAVGVGLICSQIIVRKLNWTPWRMIVVGALISSVGFAAVALASTSLMLDACFFVAAAGMGWVFPAAAALASNSVDAHHQGAAAGAMGAAQGLGVVIGPLAGTLLYEIYVGLPYLLAAAMLVSVSCWLMLSHDSKPADVL